MLVHICAARTAVARRVATHFRCSCIDKKWASHVCIGSDNDCTRLPLIRCSPSRSVGALHKTLARLRIYHWLVVVFIVCARYRCFSFRSHSVGFCRTHTHTQSQQHNYIERRPSRLWYWMYGEPAHSGSACMCVCAYITRPYRRALAPTQAHAAHSAERTEFFYGIDNPLCRCFNLMRYRMRMRSVRSIPQCTHASFFSHCPATNRMYRISDLCDSCVISRTLNQ